MKPEEGSKRIKIGRRTGDFFIQLAAVVIGVIITFGGSGLIQRNAQKREAEHLLEMVGQELRRNAVRARTQAEWFGHLKSGAVAFRPYLDNPDAAPVDTLKKYANIANNHTYVTSTHAFEILKASKAVKSISDKQFVLDLFATYENTAGRAKNALIYTDRKAADWQKYYDSVGRDKTMAVFEPTDPHAVFAHAARSGVIARYIVETAGHGDWLDNLIDEHETLATTIDEMVTKVEEYIN